MSKGYVFNSYFNPYLFENQNRLSLKSQTFQPYFSNPYDSESKRRLTDFKIKFDSFTLDERTNGQFVSIDQIKRGVQNATFTPQFNSLYTIICIDPDAPEPNNPAHRNWVQWMIINIPNSQLQLGDEIIPFGHIKILSGCHRYVFYLFHQTSGRINNPYFTYYKRCNFTDSEERNRCGFNLDEFVRRYGLCYMTHRMLKTSKNAESSECKAKTDFKRLPHRLYCVHQKGVDQYFTKRALEDVIDPHDTWRNMFYRQARSETIPSHFYWNYLNRIPRGYYQRYY